MAYRRKSRHRSRSRGRRGRTKVRRTYTIPRGGIMFT